MNIIKELTKDLKPTPPRPLICYQWFYTIIILSIIGAIYTFILGLWPSSLNELFRFPAIFYTATALLLFILLTYQSILISIPGKQNNRLPQLLGIVAVSILLVLIYFLIKNTNQTNFFYWEGTFTCALKIILMSIIPIMFLNHQINKNYVLNKNKATVILFITSGTLGLSVITFHCPIMDPMHILLWHILPIIILGFLGLSMSYFYKKNKNS